MNNFVLFGLCCFAFSGCGSPSIRKVVLYSGQDRHYAELVTKDFTKKTGIQVVLQSDTEANKAVGLFQILVREKEQPRADVFWGNEPLLMERLAEQKILEPYRSTSAGEFPESSRPGHGGWQGFAARARILLVHKDLKEKPRSLNDLLDPAWKKRVAMAKPYFGSTATHMAHLFDSLGADAAREFYTKLKENVILFPGNSDVAKEVAAGRIDIGLTDTDDAKEQLTRHPELTILWPDQESVGTLFFPNGLGLVRNGPNPEEGKKLIDYLLSREVEKQLAEGPSGQYPLNPNVIVEMKPLLPMHQLKVQWVNLKAAGKWEDTQKLLREVFQ